MKITHTLGLLAGVSLLAACASAPPAQESIGTTPQLSAPRNYTMEDLKIPQQNTVPALSPVTSYSFDSKDRPSEKTLERGVAQARERGLELPVLDCFVGTTCEYWYDKDQQYLVYMSKLNQTEVCAKEGEIILDVSVPGKQTYLPHEIKVNGSGAKTEYCVAFMPTAAKLDLQVTIRTDDVNRKYKLRVKTFPANSKNIHVEVRWRYPEDVLHQLNHPGQPTVQPVRDSDRTTGMAYRDRYCDYQVEGGTPDWKPVPTPDGQPPVCDDGQVTIINFPIGVGFLGGRPSVLRLKDDDTQMPVQYGAINSTYRVTGVHQRLLLQLGAEEVIYTRRDPVSFRTPPANRKGPVAAPPATSGGAQ